MRGKKLREAARDGVPGPLDAVECPSSFLGACREGRGTGCKVPKSHKRQVGLQCRATRPAGKAGAGIDLSSRALATQAGVFSPTWSRAASGPGWPGLDIQSFPLPRAQGRDNPLPLEQLQFPLWQSWDLQWWVSACGVKWCAPSHTYSLAPPLSLCWTNVPDGKILSFNAG